MPRSDLRSRPLLAALAAIAIGAACSQGAGPGPGIPKTREAKTDAFGVAYAAPRGEVGAAGEITIVMNRPMRSLDLAGDEAPPFATLSPEVRGRWQWVGTSGLLFAPEGKLPKATQIRVQIPAGTKALDGSSLAESFVFELSTERPRAVEVTPRDRAKGIPLDSTFSVRFNQRIDPASLAKAASLAGDGKPIEIDVRRPDPGDETLFEIAPRKRLPIDAEIRLTIGKSLKGREGPLDAGKAATYSFETFGPIKVKSSRCGYTDQSDVRCSPDADYLEIVLSNPVEEARAQAALEIDPPVPATLSTDDEEYGAQSLYVHAPFEPSTTYRVRLKKGLTDKFNQALAADWTQTFEIGPVAPVAVLGLEGSIFEPSARSDIPIISVNAPELRVATAPVDERSVLDLLSDEGSEGTGRLTDLGTATIARLSGGKSFLWKPSAGLNAPATNLVPTGPLLDAKTQRGAFALGLEYTPSARGERVVRSSVVQVTDLAITAKASRHGSLVRVSRISTGEPVAGARVSLGRPGAPASPDVFTTDTTGFTSIPADKFMLSDYLHEERAVLFARSGDDWTFRAVNAAAAIGDVYTYLDEPPAFGLIFTDRRIYRPGEVIRIKGILRREARAGTDKRSRTPAGEDVEVSVGMYDLGEIIKRTVTTTPFGTFSLDAPIPAAAKLGYYRIEAKMGGEPVHVDAVLEVAEYRPNEIEVSVTSEKPSYLRGESATFAIKGELLSGPPLAGGDGRVMVYREPATFAPPGLPEGFLTGDEAYSDALDRVKYRSRIQVSNIKLDVGGKATLPVGLSLPEQRGPETITCEAEIGDRAAQPVANRARILLHAAETYVGLDPGIKHFARAKTPFLPRVVAVDTKGSQVGAKVRIELINRVYETRAARRRISNYQGSFEDRVIASCDVVADGAPASCPLTAERAGSYILRASATDKRGNPTASSTRVYVAGEGAAGVEQSGDPLQVELVADKALYDIGQTARILVKSPFPSATALVTVERAGVYSRKTMTLTGASPMIEVPVTEELWPNAFVSVILTRPARGAKGGAADAVRIGYATLDITPDARRLRVDVKPSSPEATPGSSVDVDVTVRDRAGKPVRAEVTLYAVDKGVLSLTGEQRPDPAAVFGTPRPLRVVTIESREDLARVLNAADALHTIGTVGHGAASGALRERKDFRTTAHYDPTLMTDANGVAKARINLPDSLTSYRITAVAAAADDRTGSGEADLQVSLPLMVRPAVPRILRAGDTVSIGALITSRLAGRSGVDIEVSAKGLTPLGDLKRRVEVKRNEPVEARFSFSAPRVGKAIIQLTAKADGGPSDRVTLEREVRAPAVLEAAALYGQTEASAKERLGDLAAMRDDVGGLELRLSSTALVGLDGGFEQLFDYPYGCTEQLVSRLLPLVSLRDLARAYQIPLPVDTDRRIEDAVAKILTAQKSGGGFGFWPESPRMSDWITAYALWGLVEAKRAGVRVPAKAIDEAMAYLRGALEQDTPDERSERAFVVDIVAMVEIALGGRVSAPIQKKIAAIFENRGDLSLPSRAMLAHAMAIAGLDAPSRERIGAELEGHIRLDGPLARAVTSVKRASVELLDSDARTTALVLRALVANKPAHPMASRLARGLVADRRGGAWRSTQETIWALIALDQYRRAQEPAPPDFKARALLGGAEVLSGLFQKGSPLEVKRAVEPSSIFNAQDPSLAFSAEGKGTLFYEARLRYARKELPARPLERGFFIQKTLRAVTPEGLTNALASSPLTGQTTFRTGDLVLADVIVMTPSPRRFVAIDDPLPAGLEPVDTGLASASEYLAGALASADWDDSKGPYLSAWAREELRDDRALFFLDQMPAGMYRFRYLARAISPGSFVMPSSKAEEMYAPEVFGRSGAGKVTITMSEGAN
jgi:hypothetical protein